MCTPERHDELQSSDACGCGFSTARDRGPVRVGPVDIKPSKVLVLQHQIHSRLPRLVLDHLHANEQRKHMNVVDGHLGADGARPVLPLDGYLERETRRRVKDRCDLLVGHSHEANLLAQGDTKTTDRAATLGGVEVDPPVCRQGHHVATVALGG